MSKIKAIPEGLRDKIRAGEVVERPASVVKEAVENSIDAGCRNVTVEVRKGGKSLIRVVDDGEGMSREDAIICLGRHTTSKLASEDDLQKIMTMGFRGEALPSIASVSRLRLITAPRGEVSGTLIEAEGGNIGQARDAASEGTTLEVRDLFFNTPARRKFLKTDTTEFSHVINTVTRYALAYPEKGFALHTDGREALGLPRASGLRERLLQLYGVEYLEGMLEMQGGRQGLGISGYVSKPGNFRGTKSHQYIFVNQRPVKDSRITAAVYSSYEGGIPRSSHPMFFIFIKTDPGRVDVNVHPTKEEVRFEDRDAVYRVIVSAVKGALALSMREGALADTGRPVTDTHTEEAVRRHSGVAYTHPGVYVEEMVVADVGEAKTPEAAMIAETTKLAYTPDIPFIYLGETFIAYPDGNGVTIIDHHAAHERVMYEKFLKGVRLNTKGLLFPKQVRLSPAEYETVLSHKKELQEMGLEIDDFGKDTVIVRSLPSELEGADIAGILGDAANDLIEGRKPGGSAAEALAASIACHSSVRGSRMLGKEEFRSLLSELREAENPTVCPHGRPTMVSLSFSELRRLFGRK